MSKHRNAVRLEESQGASWRRCPGGSDMIFSTKYGLKGPRRGSYSEAPPTSPVLLWTKQSLIEAGSHWLSGGPSLRIPLPVDRLGPAHSSLRRFLPFSLLTRKLKDRDTTMAFPRCTAWFGRPGHLSGRLGEDQHFVVRLRSHLPGGAR